MSAPEPTNDPLAATLERSADWFDEAGIGAPDFRLAAARLRAVGPQEDALRALVERMGPLISHHAPTCQWHKTYSLLRCDCLRTTWRSHLALLAATPQDDRGGERPEDACDHRWQIIHMGFAWYCPRCQTEVPGRIPAEGRAAPPAPAVRPSGDVAAATMRYRAPDGSDEAGGPDTSYERRLITDALHVMGCIGWAQTSDGGWYHKCRSWAGNTAAALHHAGLLAARSEGPKDDEGSAS